MSKYYLSFYVVSGNVLSLFWTCAKGFWIDYAVATNIDGQSDRFLVRGCNSIRQYINGNAFRAVVGIEFLLAVWRECLERIMMVGCRAEEWLKQRFLLVCPIRKKSKQKKE